MEYQYTDGHSGTFCHLKSAFAILFPVSAGLWMAANGFEDGHDRVTETLGVRRPHVPGEAGPCLGPPL